MGNVTAGPAGRLNSGGFMGLFSAATGIVKARTTHLLLRRFLGGPLSTVLIAGYVGHKAYQMYRNRQTRIS